MNQVLEVLIGVFIGAWIGVGFLFAVYIALQLAKAIVEFITNRNKEE